MADKIISFAHRAGGVLTDVTSAVLNDAAASYGLRLAASPFTVVVPAGTALTHDGTGLYSYAVTGLTAGAEYQYALQWVYLGETKRQVRTFAVDATNYAGRYTTQEAVRTWLGTINADILADLDGDGSPDAGAWEQVIRWAEGKLDFYAGGGPADVPFTYTGGDAAQQAAAEDTISEWATKLAGVELAVKRLPLTKEQRDALVAERKAVLEEIALWRSGGAALPGLTPVAAAADDTAEPGQFQFVTVDRGTGCGGDEFSCCG